MMGSKCRFYQNGFTLLETLVAFAILVLVLAVVFQVFGNGSRSARMSHEYVQAVIIAQSLLAESRIDGSVSQSGERAGYRWELTRKLANYADFGYTSNYEQVGMSAYDVEVTVTWQRGAKERKVSLNSVDLDVNP